MCFEIRKWDGDEWPDKRISIADKNNGAVAINARYQDDEVTMKYFKLFTKAPLLHSHLEHILNLWVEGADPKDFEMTVNATKLFLKETDLHGE